MSVATVRGSEGCFGSRSILHGCTMSRVPPVIEDDEHEGYCSSTGFAGFAAEWSADIRAAVTLQQYWIRCRVVLPGAPLVYLCLRFLQSRDAVARISTGRSPSPRLQLERTPLKTGAVR